MPTLLPLSKVRCLIWICCTGPQNVGRRRHRPPVVTGPSVVMPPPSPLLFTSHFTPLPAASTSSRRPSRHPRYLKHDSFLTTDDTSRCKHHAIDWTPRWWCLQRWSNRRVICKRFKLLGNTINLHLTAPLCIAPLGLIEEAPCTTKVWYHFVVIASKLTCKTLLMNESRRASRDYGSGVGCLGVAMVAIRWKLFSF